MSVISHGKIAPVLSDGSSLLQSMDFTMEQSASLQHDLAVLTKADLSRKLMKTVEVSVRVIAVLILVTTGALLWNQLMNEYLALAIVIPLLFVTDIFCFINKKMNAKREQERKSLKMLRTVFTMASGHSFNKTMEQKTEDYFSLLRTGKLLFGTEASSYRLVLSGDNGSPQTLTYRVG